MIEVLLCLAIGSTGFIALVGTARRQAVAARSVQIHREARLILDEVVEGFQVASSVPPDSAVRLGSIAFTIQTSELSESIGSSGGVDTLGVDAARRVEAREFRVAWVAAGKQFALARQAWRYPTDGQTSDQRLP